MTELSASNIEMVVGFKIQNLLDASTLQGICARKNVSVRIAHSTSELRFFSEENVRTLIICDLSFLSNSEMRELSKGAKNLGVQILGFYPHVIPEIRRSALDSGIDLVVPRSAFRAKLETILS